MIEALMILAVVIGTLIIIVCGALWLVSWSDPRKARTEVFSSPVVLAQRCACGSDRVGKFCARCGQPFPFGEVLGDRETILGPDGPVVVRTFRK